MYRALLVSALAGGLAALRVEQVHLSLTETPVAEMRAMWVIQTPIGSAPAGFCEYGTAGGAMGSKAAATTATYSEDGFAGTIYDAVMTGLSADTKYAYRCGYAGNTSATFSFSTAPPASKTIRVVSYGDMGTAAEGASEGRDPSFTQAAVAREVNGGGASLILNVGDSSYADDHAAPNFHYRDDYFNEVEGYAAYAPFQLCPGNHEAQYKYAAHLARTKMPVQGTGPSARFYHSFDWGPMHVLTYSTDGAANDQGSEQWNFVKADLEKANGNRKNVPWLVVFTHHAFYCTDLITENTRCGPEAATYHSQYEELFHDNGVDLHIAGHNHQYERSWPTYKGEATAKSYAAPKAPTYVVNGAAGDTEAVDPTWMPDSKFRAFHDQGFNTGYLRFSVNTTAMDFEYVRSKSGDVVDKFTITH